VHWHLSKVFSLPLLSSTWFTYCPPPVVENATAKILWDFSLISEGYHLTNHPDLVLFDYDKKAILFIEVSCTADINVVSKETEKFHKYQPLASGFHSMYHMCVDIVPIVIGHSGVMTVQCQQFLQCIPQFTTSLLCHLEKAALIGMIRILRTLNL